MKSEPTDRLTLVYLGEGVYHRSHADDDLRPACTPTRMRGVLTMTVRAARRGLTACRRCWPENERDGSPAS